MSEQREMTLDEWCRELPEFHLANKELSKLRARVAELEAARGGPVAWMLKTGHGTAFATVKPECEIDLWVPLFALKDK